MAEGREAPHESLNNLNIIDWSHFGDGRDFVRICFDAVLEDDVSQELAPGDSEGAFLWRLLKVSSRFEMRLLLFQDFIMMSST
jgi:hypothetical protein